jgi:transcriptional regulator with XRE-family HTH domain
MATSLVIEPQTSPGALFQEMFPPRLERQVVRCQNRRCKLFSFAQYFTKNGLCRYCHKDLDPERPKTPKIVADYPLLTVGKLLCELRKEKNLTQKQLAEKMGGIPRSYISKVENDKLCPELDQWMRFAESLGISLFTLLDRTWSRVQIEVLLSHELVGGVMDILSTLDPVAKAGFVKLMLDTDLLEHLALEKRLSNSYTH